MTARDKNLIAYSVIFVVVVICGCAVYIVYTFTSVQRSSVPVMQWKQVRDEGFVLQPGEVYTGFFVPKNIPIGTVRVAIQATSPVSVSYVPEQYRQVSMSKAALEEISNVPMFACMQTGILHTTLQCPLSSDAGHYLWVFDERTRNQAIDGGIAAAFGVKRPAEQFSIRNDVRVVYSIYECVQNCSETEAPQKP